MPTQNKPLPTTWLNQRRWEDDIESGPAGGKPTGRKPEDQAIFEADMKAYSEAAKRTRERKGGDGR